MLLEYELRDFATIYSPKWKDGWSNIDINFDAVLHAAYTVGKANYDDVFSEPYYSNNEVDFRINMVKSFLKEGNQSIIKSPIYSRLDPSEKVAINYFFGMLFSKLMAEKVFGFPWLMHLDVYGKGISNIGTIPIILSPGKSRPDFIGVNKLGDWLVLESKGRAEYRSKALSDAKEQVRKLIKINGKNPFLRIGVLTYYASDEINIKVVDPPENKEEKEILEVNESDFIKDYYAKIYMYLMDDEQSSMQINNLHFIVKHNSCLNITFGLQKDIYRLVDEYVDDEKLDLFNNVREQAIKIEKQILEIQSSSSNDSVGFVGSDGILIIGKKKI